MMTPLDAQSTDVCQCTKVKGAGGIECELGTTVICPACHLEEANTREPNDAAQTAVEQTALPDERRVYIAFESSRLLKETGGQHLSDKSIRSVIKRRQKGQTTARHLLNEYGISALVTSLRALVDAEIFTSTDAASRRFPDLFPEEQETATGDLSTKEIEPHDGECNQSNDASGGFGGNHVFPNLEHACFSFAQREMQQALDKWDYRCAEAVSLQTWIDLFRNNKTFETEGNAGSLPNLLSSVGKIQNVIIHRLDLNFFQVNQFLLNAEEFIRLLDTPLYLDAIKLLRQRIEEVLLMANRDAASIHNEADGKVAEIEAQRERLNREEEGVKRHRDENLDNIRDSIERDIFAAMGQAKDALPGIGLADNR
ncbi:hypothetical protein FOC4_g10000798 [Fusarium odoratissimum]|uniref:Uncharacterized protein n=2 Tax=Fusarium oxysporum species complex TaxID=171631 RepID=N1S4L0_FUSC4|nr:hypothetical protein FOC4_g10000798 [Fusarium odoratissimum]TXB97539.1 hypothetical protein FocTR4_00012280 [Fusarium oxysporum f. sp. cubense]